MRCHCGSVVELWEHCESVVEASWSVVEASRSIVEASWSIMEEPCRFPGGPRMLKDTCMCASKATMDFV